MSGRLGEEGFERELRHTLEQVRCLSCAPLCRDVSFILSQMIVDCTCSVGVSESSMDASCADCRHIPKRGVLDEKCTGYVISDPHLACINSTSVEDV